MKLVIPMREISTLGEPDTALTHRRVAVFRWVKHSGNTIAVASSAGTDDDSQNATVPPSILILNSPAALANISHDVPIIFHLPLLNNIIVILAE
ncbi:hypothetical protein EAW94_24760 [Salmonella enterica]|nr:hypothetical protein [Salmonella enterica]